MSASSTFDILFKWLLPPFLVCGFIFRINGISLGYLLCLLVAGLCKSRELPGGGQRALTAVVFALSTVSLLGQALFQITRTTSYADDQLQPNNGSEPIWRQVGFNQMSDFSGGEMVRYVLPDIGICLLSLTLLILALLANRRTEDDAEEDSVKDDSAGEDSVKDDNAENIATNETDNGAYELPRLRTSTLFNLVYCLLLLLAGCAFPSILSFTYLALFICIVTLWASHCTKRGSDMLSIVKYMMVIYAGLQLILLYLYLFQFFQEGLDSGTVVARILGLNAIVNTTDYEQPWELKLQDDVKWSEYLAPILILVLYWFSARGVVYESQRIRRQVHGDSPGTPTSAEQEEVLSRDGSTRVSTRSSGKLINDKGRSFKRTSTLSGESGSGGGGGGVAVDGTSSWRPRSMHDPAVMVVVSMGGETSVVDPTSGAADSVDPELGSTTPAGQQQQQAQPDTQQIDGAAGKANKQREEQEPFDSLLAYGYIAALIAMMVWSIAYLSWLSFALLLLTFLIWVLPEPGRGSAIMSPFLVFYSASLVIMEYVYGLNLTDKELPQYEDVGLVRHPYPFGHLLLKVLFFCVVLIPMYYFFSEDYKKSVKRNKAIHETAKQNVKDKAGTEKRSPNAATGKDALREDRASSIAMQDLRHADQGPDEGPGSSDETPMRDTDANTDQGDGAGDASEDADGNAEDKTRRPILWVITVNIVAVLTKYWIVVCLVLYLIASLLPSVSVFKIIYMAFFLLFLITSQLTGACCVGFLHAFWCLAVMYSMFVVATLYSYQFSYVADNWNITLPSQDWIDDLGLESYRTYFNDSFDAPDSSLDSGQLFVNLLLPVTVLLFAVMYLRFFYAPSPSTEYLLYKAEAREKKKIYKAENKEKKKLIKAEQKEEKKRNQERSGSGRRAGRGGSARRTDVPDSSIVEDASPGSGATSPVEELDAKTRQEGQSASAAATATSQAILAGDDTGQPNDSTAGGDTPKKEPNRIVVWIRNLVWLIVLKLYSLIRWFFTMLIRCLDVHMGKVILLVILAVSLEEVCCANLFAVIFVCITLLYSHNTMLSYALFDLWAVISILAKMGFQLKSVRNYRADQFFFRNCTGNSTDTAVLGPYQDDAAWIGLLHKAASDFPGYIQGYVWILALVVLRIWIHRYQTTVRNDFKEDRNEAISCHLEAKRREREQEAREAQVDPDAPLAAESLHTRSTVPDHLSKVEERALLARLEVYPAPVAGSIFADVDAHDADQDLLSAICYLINNFFELFGQEMVIIVCGIVVAVRLDGVALVYGVMLGFLVSPLRRHVTGFFALFTILLMLVQYLLVLGVPPSVCYVQENGYPWSPMRWLHADDASFAHHFYLTDPNHPQNKWLLLADFFLLLCLSTQWHHYRAIARRVKQSAATNRANKKYANFDAERCATVDGDGQPTQTSNPTEPGVPDFTALNSWLDYTKNLIFQHFFWITLVIVFFAGAARNSILCLGYLLFAFVFLWMGTDQLHDPKPDQPSDEEKRRKASRKGDKHRQSRKRTGSRTELPASGGQAQVDGADTMHSSDQAQNTTKDSGATETKRKKPSFVRRWKILLWYTYFVILVKTALQIWACVDFGDGGLNCIKENKSGLCIFARLLSLVCLKPLEGTQTQDGDAVGLTLDVVSLAFLLFQIRIFNSPHFVHVQNHLNLFAKFADNGVGLMRTLLAQRLNAQKRYESEMETDIKKHVKYLEDHPDEFQILYEGTFIPDHWQQPSRVKSESPEKTAESSSRGIASSTTHQLGKLRSGGGVAPALSFAAPVGGSEIDGGGEEEMIMYPAVLGTEETDGEHADDVDEEQEDDDEPMSEDAFDSYVQRMSVPRKIKKAVDEFFDATIIRWLDEVSFDYLYVETRLRRLMHKEKIKQQKAQGVEPGDLNIDTSLQPRGTSMKVFGDTTEDSEDTTAHSRRNPSRRDVDRTDGDAENADDTDGVPSPKNAVGNFFRQTSTIQKMTKKLAVSDASHIPIAESDPIVRLLRFGRTVEKDEEAEATEKFLRSELADVVYVPIRFGWALYYAMLARTDVFCYFVMILDHVISASVLTLPLPFFVFLWGTMSKPRPSTTFWSTGIIYIQAVIVIKYIFQSETLADLFDNDSGRPLWAPRIFGVGHHSDFSRSVAADLVVLLSLCFHRAILRFHGFWGDAADSDAEVPIIPTKNAAETNKKMSSGDNTSSQNASAPQQPKGAGSTGRTTVASALEMESVPEASVAMAGASSSPQKQGRADSVNSPRLTHSLAASSDTSKSGQDGKASKAGTLASSGKKKKKKRNVLWRVFVDPLYKFYEKALDEDQGGGRKDYYTVMFSFDLITFLITVFGWSSFSEKSTSASADVTTYISQNYIPRTFLAMVLVQFLLMIVDRILYLRKLIFVKFVFQITLLIAVHAWLFFILPAISERSFNDNPVAQLWYFSKCMYFAVAAMQLAAGYPTRILGQFLTKGANIISAVLFLIVQAIPFLLEFRELLDWACTPTVLSIMYWFKVQDIWSSIFVIKSFRTYEKSAPRKIGTTVSLVVKALVGGLGVVALILVLWFPLVLMSLINSTSLSNPPKSVSVQLQIGGFQPLFHFTADQQFLTQITESDMKNLRNKYQDPESQAFLTKYVASDVTRVSIPGQSSALWSISPPSRRLMEQNLNNPNHSIDIAFLWTIVRETQTGLAAETVSQINSTSLPHSTNETTIRTALYQILSRNTTRNSTMIQSLYPSFILAPANGPANPVLVLNNAFVNVSLQWQEGGQYGGEWWELVQTSPHILDSSDSATLELFIISDRVAAPEFSFLAGYGVIGLYVSLVLVVGQFLRLIFKNISHRIIYENIPNPDPLHQLCHNIFMAREMAQVTGKYYLEERLAGQLFLLYRSPERLVEETRPPLQRTYTARDQDGRLQQPDDRTEPAAGHRQSPPAGIVAERQTRPRTRTVDAAVQ
ncbi:piezo-type mechanosensitive ion channel component 1-like isoform X2 [Sycon ciliatum]|uniref:piezo-type mechanosensitive ion channel component 1-like isoform X2 n=1 Tax=Sycon ciliatum TaxID=27933 RepID=UPI0031F6A329